MSVFTNPASASKEAATTYTRAVLDLLGDRDPTTVLRSTGTELRRAVEGLSEEQLSRRERPGKWSVRQVLRHVADAEIVWAWRMRLALANDRPPITGFDQDA